MEEWRIPLTILIVVIISTSGFWLLFYRWLIRNREKIHGRPFEYLFFLLLFFAGYWTTWISSGALKGPQVVSRFSLVIACIISSIFAGYLHYIKKMYT